VLDVIYGFKHHHAEERVEQVEVNRFHVEDLANEAEVEDVSYIEAQKPVVDREGRDPIFCQPILFVVPNLGVTPWNSGEEVVERLVHVGCRGVFRSGH